MRKGKQELKRKYISIMLIPHYPSRTKAIKVSSLYKKLALVALLLVSIVITSGLYVRNTIKENAKLKQDIDALYEMNLTQKDMLLMQSDIVDSKSQNISALQNEVAKRDEYINNQINEVMEKYRQISDMYVENRINISLISRSGDRSEDEFANDVKELKDLLLDLSTISTADDIQVFNLSESTDKLESYLSSIPTFWPAKGSIASPFGNRIDPFDKKISFHKGIDISAPYNAPIYASGDGEVIFSDYNGTYGKCVMIDHGQGVVSVYAHASTIKVSLEKQVKQGDLIALVGSTGRSTGAHLHFEIRLNNNPVNPIEFLD